MIDIKKIKDLFRKDKLAKIKIDKEKFMKRVDLFKNQGKKAFDKSVKLLKAAWAKSRALIIKLKDKINKEDIKRLFILIKSSFTKEKIKNYYESIKLFFKKDNLKNTLEKLKVSFKENTKAYVIFGSIGIFLVVSLVLSIRQLTNTVATSALHKKISITNNAAEEYFYKGQYDKAIEEYIKLQQKDPSEGLWFAKMSEIYSVMGNIESSKEYLGKAKELGSKNAVVLNYIVFTEFMNKDYSSALQQGEESLAQFPKDKKLIKTMFTVYMANNMLEKAKDLIAGYPADIKSAYEIAEYARMLMVVGQWEEGYKELRVAWNVDKDEYKIYDVLAQISVYNNDIILENVTSLAEKNPNDLAYKMWLAKIYSLSEATAEQATKLIEELKQHDIGKIEIKLIEAAALQNLKQTEQADELIKKVIDENKNDYRVLHTAGWYYLNKMNFTLAENYCRESIAKNKDYTDNYGFLMPEILKAQGKSVEGEPYFRTAMYKEPYNYNIMLTIANYYWYTTKDSEKALEHFKFAEIVKPNDGDIKYNMALINISNNRIDEAVELLKQSIKISDGTAKYHRTLGTIYLLNGSPADAIKEIRYAYGSDETDIMTLNNAGCYYTTQDLNLERGEYNLRKAQEGITEATDKYTSDTIKSNYKKVKELLDKYNSGSSGTLKIPELTLFY
jgi:tetratricopeptide (TPR) repeat protein